MNAKNERLAVKFSNKKDKCRINADEKESVTNCNRLDLITSRYIRFDACYLVGMSK